MDGEHFDLRRWHSAMAESRALLRRSEELLAHRAELIRDATDQFRDVVRLARSFTNDALKTSRRRPDDDDAIEKGAKSTDA